MKTTLSQSSLTFPVISGLAPLSPIGAPSPREKQLIPSPYNVHADYSNGELTVLATVLLPAPQLECTVTQVFSVDQNGDPRLLLYFCYDLEDSDYTQFFSKTYRLVVDPTPFPSNFNLAEVKSIEFFVWNEDPKTSRGTVTTVSHSNTGSTEN